MYCCNVGRCDGGGLEVYNHWPSPELVANGHESIVVVVMVGVAVFKFLVIVVVMIINHSA